MPLSNLRQAMFRKNLYYMRVNSVSIFQFIRQLMSNVNLGQSFLVLLFVFGTSITMTTHAQERVSIVSGIVTDENGETMPGATVTLQGVMGGTITNIDGEYSINVKEGDMLVFSFIGMENSQIKYTGQKVINMVMRSQTDELDEVTIVAFGKQKKESVIASIETIKPAELKVPSSNLTTALAGRMSGIISYQRSGEPGQDNAEFFIRGATTFGYKNTPLILIDGIELTTRDLARLQPDDIASFSIMKDATATALYGARGANGVILVTTKEGREGTAKLSFRYERSISQPTRMIEIADPVTYMKMHNEAILTRNPLGGREYSLEKIRMTQQPNRNKMAYPAVNWFDELFEKQAINDRFNFNVGGGGKVARYYLAGTFNTDNGILKVDPRNNFNNNVKYNRVSLRSNININVTKTTEVAVRFNTNFDDYNGPIDGGEDLFRKALRTNPVLYPKYYEPDAKHENTSHILFGNAGQFGSYLNPYADMVRGYKDESRSSVIASVELKQKLDFITKGLSARLMGNTHRESFSSTSSAYNPFYYSIGNSYDPETDTYVLTNLNPGQGTEYLEASPGGVVANSSQYFEGSLNYNNTFGDKHNFTGMLVSIIREYKTSLSANDVELSLPYRNIGISGRFTYGFDNRYFTEFNFGYNGSERFSQKERFGFFPSVGAGWMVSNEDFWKPISTIVNKLKLKGTYGFVGNDAIGDAQDRFFYMSKVNMNDGSKGTTYGDEFRYFVPGISIDRYSNDQITWEVATMVDLGIEIGLFDKLEFQGDYFYEYRDNILMNRSEVPSTLGTQADLRANLGAAASRGVDMSLDFNHNFSNNLWVSARGNFTYATSQFEKLEELDYVSAGLPWRSSLGNSLSQHYGLIAERLFIDEADIANSPVQDFGPADSYMAGDIKYKDINNDGIINDNDIVPIGYPATPEIVYGFGASTGFKGVDFSFFFQGSARSSFFIDVNGTSPFVDNKALLTAWEQDHWSEDNRNLYAAWPRLSEEIVENNNRPSTWFLRDGSFLRLKSVELGYTFTEKTFISKVKLSSFRIYASGTNLFLFAPFDLWDVEMGGNGLGYPIQKVVNIGLNASF